MVFEDFVNDWTENDPDGELTVTTNKIETSGFDGDGDARMSKDAGVDHFTDTLTHQFELTAANINALNFVAEFYSLRDTIPNNFDSGFQIYIANADQDNYGIAITEFERAFDTDQTDTILDFATKYYIEVIRTSSPNITVKIRTGSHTGSLIDTLVVVDVGSSLRYALATVEEED